MASGGSKPPAPARIERRRTLHPTPLEFAQILRRSREGRARKRATEARTTQYRQYQTL
jgi:hypothetical protein